MARKSKARTMLTGRWIRWFVFRELSRAFPPFGHYFNFPTLRLAARHIANPVFEDCEQIMHFDAPDALYETVVMPSRFSDAGETWRYAERKTIYYRFCGVIADCDINTLDMRLIHRPTFKIVDYWDADVPASLIKPSRLKSLPADPTKLYACLGSTSNYYHYLMDYVLPLISALRRFAESIGTLTVLLRRDAPSFAHEILAALAKNFPTLAIELVEPGQRIEGARALYTIRFARAREWVPFDNEDVEILRRTLLAHYRLPAAAAERDVYVSRRGARLRALATEDELIGELTNRGFNIFTPRADNHAEQVRMFSSARKIVAVHGAALTNLLFAPTGSEVVELFARDHIKSPYIWIAQKLGLRYRPVFGSDSDLWQGFSLPPQQVTEALDGPASSTTEVGLHSVLET